MRSIFYMLLSGACLCTRVSAQVSGTVTVPGTYSSVVSLLADLNLNGTSGPLTINISAGYTETAIAGGFTLSASGTATAPIVIQKSGTGNNPVIYGYVGSKTPGSAVQDGIWRMNGCDYVTVNAIDLFDGNTTNPSTMEFGYGLFKSSSSDGCHHVTIKNCVISLSKSNNSSGSGPAADGSRGIEMVNGLMSSHNASLAVTSAGGAHSYNTFILNRIQDCNIGISFSGFLTASNFSLCDNGNEVGSLIAANGNTIINFGGGGSNGSAGIRAFAQYDLLIGSNVINSDNGPGTPHPGTLRGIHVGPAPAANISVVSNTVTVHGGGTGNNLSCIENSGGGSGQSNTVIIKGNVLLNSTYNTAINGSFYGIWNSATAGNLSIKENVLNNNSSMASGGSNYLIYNNGGVSNSVVIDSNQVSFTHAGTPTYTGTLYGIYNTSAGGSASVSIINNIFKNFNHEVGPGSGVLYFIYNTADVDRLEFKGNKWRNLQMNHSGPEFFIYNSSATHSLLTVESNSVINHIRNAASANLYVYYGAASVVPTASHVILNNFVSGITSTVAGVGNFYGLYCAEGNNSPYPLKSISGNTITNIRMQGNGNFYGIYVTDLGDAGTASSSFVGYNHITGCEFADAIYGIYCSSPTSPSNVARVKKNIVRGITSYTGTAYGAYVGSNNAGIYFSENKISNVSALGNAGTAYGLYCTTTSTSNIVNNIIGNIEAPISGGANRSNGIYINSGTLVNVYHNSVWVSAASTGSNFGCNALYVSSTAGLMLKNNLIVNTSTVTGTGIGAAYRRSSTSVANYNSASGNNLFYAGTPGSAHPLYYNGSSYSTLSALQTLLSPREAGSVSQMPVFKSTNPLSPFYLHLGTYTASSSESGAGTITAVPSDFEDDPRFGSTGYTGAGTAPDIGADEFETNTVPCTTVTPAGISVGSFSVCAGQTIALVASSVTPGSGLQHTWKMGASPGGPYNSIISSAPEYFSPALNAGNYYYMLESVCVAGSASVASAEVTVVVNPLPLANAVAQSTFVCAGDTIFLSVPGNTNSLYNWTGPSGFNSTEQNPRLVARNVDLSGNYFVEITDGMCASLPGAPVTVTINEVVLNLTADKSIICNGDSTVLLATGTSVSYTWSTGAGTGSVTVTPSVSATFSVLAEDVFACKAENTVSIVVVDGTIAPVHATVCGSASSCTLGVLVYQPSIIRWYSSSVSTVDSGLGDSFTLPAFFSDTMYAEATALSPLNLRMPMNGTLSVPGLMFDIVPNAQIRISGLDIHLPGTSVYSVEIWYNLSSITTANTSSLAWTSLGSSTVAGAGQDQITTLPFILDLPAAPSQTMGLYVSVSGGSISCSNPGSTQTIWMLNNDLAVLTGNAGSYFNCTSTGWGFNGQLRYNRVLCTTPRIPVSLLVAQIPTVVAVPTSSVICPGNSVTITASGAKSYSWTGIGTKTVLIVTPTLPQTYTVKGKSIEGCISEATVSIGFHPIPTISATAASTLVCPSSPVVLTATGANTFVWNTGAGGPTVNVNPPVPTTYTAFGTNTEGCTSAGTVAISTLSVPVIKIQQSADTVCPFEAVVLKATGAQTYTWLPGFNAQQSTTVFPSVSSVFNAIGSSVNSCTNVGYAHVFVDACTGFAKGQKGRQEKEGRVEVYPNPSSNIFNVTMPPGDKEMVIISSYGATIYRNSTDDTSYIIDLNSPAGLYCLIVNWENQQFEFRIVKE